MKHRQCLVRTMVLCGFYAVSCHAAMVRQYDFPELVERSPLIVTGDIAVTNATPILAVRSVLKGTVAQKELIIETMSLGDMPPVQFTNGETVVLFLQEAKADGKASLFGYGDQGKWPRLPTSGGFPVMLGRVSTEGTIQMIQQLLAISKLEGNNERLLSLGKWLQSSDKAKQLVALQYVSDGFLWSPSDQKSARSPVNLQDRQDVQRRLLPHISQLVDSEEPSIRRELIRVFRFAPREMAKPFLEKGRLDKDNSVREAVTEVQTTLSD